ncbi:hypothetical protein LSH36_251g03116 [Paralvinella palmiformis]|uniref:Sister chromatid cohesion protein DCC1 n=1 Tax=Paralvinella palmiformis TaxID=53620 RepID=A0AAD9JKR4_9ANNE|nr:hypothetical protein LSH36_251g03116 [Paralvinella palmiformis]
MKHILEENMYSGQEYEADDHHQGSKYTMDDLRDLIQASDIEITQGLVDLQACLINGYWRLLDFDFLSKLLNDLIQLQDEHGWSYNAIPAEVCCDELQEIYSRDVLIHVLRCYSVLPQGESLHVDVDIAVNQSYKLDEDKICRFFAELLLRPVDKFNLKDFCDTWQQAVPEGMNTSLYQLEGAALVERNTNPEVITYYPVNELPEDSAERFNSLFKKKAKWSLEEITPYLRDLCTEKVGVSTLLLKYARASTQNGTKLYSSKKLMH